MFQGNYYIAELELNNASRPIDQSCLVVYTQSISSLLSIRQIQSFGNHIIGFLVDDTFGNNGDSFVSSKMSLLYLDSSQRKIYAFYEITALNFFEDGADIVSCDVAVVQGSQNSSMESLRLVVLTLISQAPDHLFFFEVGYLSMIFTTSTIIKENALEVRIQETSTKSQLSESKIVFAVLFSSGDIPLYEQRASISCLLL